MAKLIIYPSSGLPLVFFLDAAEVRLGQDPGNAICLDEVSVASFHALLQWQEGVVVVEDLGSGQGTAVNGEGITRRVLREGDRMSFGSVEAVFVGSEAGSEWAALSGEVAEARRRRDALAEEVAGLEERGAAAAAGLAQCQARLASFSYDVARADQVLAERQRQRAQVEAEHAQLAGQVNRWQDQAAVAARLADALAADQAKAEALRGELAEALARRAQGEAAPRLGEELAESGDGPGESVYGMACRLFSKLDLIDDLIVHFASAAPRAAEQMELLRDAFLQLLEEYGIAPYWFEPGMAVDVAVRKRIQIVETVREADVVGTRIVRSCRPGYVGREGAGGSLVLLRKAEVVVAVGAGGARRDIFPDCGEAGLRHE